MNLETNRGEEKKIKQMIRESKLSQTRGQERYDVTDARTNRRRSSDVIPQIEEVCTRVFVCMYQPTQ